MTTLEFLLYLRSLDVKLWGDGEGLRISAPKGVLTPALRGELAERKEEILAFLYAANVAAHSNPPQLQPMARDGGLPLSFSQQRLWFLNQMEQDSPVYNITKAIRMSGTLNVEALENALNAIIARHEVLRTTFASVDGSPVQAIGGSWLVELPIVDLRQWPDGEREAEVQRLISEQALRPFNLSQDSMLRATLLWLGEEKHLLLLIMHHIAFDDSWSMGVLFREMAALYEAFSARQPSPLPDLPIQYADFAGWQRQCLQGDVLESQLSYWRQQLGDSPLVLELPTDHPRPAVQTYRGARQSLALPKTLSDSLQALSRQEGVTLFITLLAAFNTLLYRYTAQDDIVVGSPIAGRTRVETEGLIGFFINNLVLRTDLSGIPSFRELLGRVRKVALGAYAHQDIPFEKLVEELQPTRDLSRNPLFQVMFALQNTPRFDLKLPGLTLSSFEVDNGTARFDLTLYLAETDGGLTGAVRYSTDLFDAATITRMLGHFSTLLAGIVANPDQQLSDLPLLTEAERQQLVVEWNETWADCPRDSCINQLFEMQVEQTPDALAVVFEDQELTYQELNHRANQLAGYLRALRVRPEVLVGICLEPSLDMVVGVLGILKAGGAYMPLDPAYPKERLAFMLEDAQVPVLLTQERLLPQLPRCEAQVVCLDAGWDAIAREMQENPGIRVNGDHLAYVIYTSGSTGTPKGVQILHRSLVNCLNSISQKVGLTDQDTLLAVTTLSFDIAALEIILPLVVGARVVVVSHEVASDGTQLLKKLTDSGATAMQATPATWRLLLGAVWPGSNRFKVLCGGDTLSLELAVELLDRGCSVWNLYGPTETTIWSATYQVER